MATLPRNPVPNDPQNVKYFSNCRGVNFLPIMHSEWEKSGFLPRYGNTSLYARSYPGATPVDGSNVFLGTNKTSQWRYYNSADIEHCIRMLRSVGINAVRSFLDIYTWQHLRTQFLLNLKDFMRICDKYKMRVQLVVWDGVSINVEGVTVPTTRTMADASSLEYGLSVQWQPNPYQFELSSVSQAQNFYTTCAVGYLGDICSSVSSYQSLWSFDISNEINNTPEVSSLLRSTSLYLSGALSSINIGLTTGYGSTYDQFSGPLYGGVNNHYPNLLTNLSASLNFVSIHPYIFNSYAVARHILLEVSSGKSQLRLPAMFSESSDPNGAQYTDDVIKYFTSSLGFGGLSFDGLIEDFPSNEPFRDTQGLFFWDGKVRRGEDASAYVSMALTHGWLRPSQLNRLPEEKVTTVDNGLDGGYYSGTPSIHGEFNPTLYVSANQAEWSRVKNWIYSVIIPIATPTTGSKTSTPFPGHPLAHGYLNSVAASGYKIEDYISICSSYATYFSSLSSIPETESGDIFLARNRELWLRDELIDNIGLNVFQIHSIPRSQIIGTQWDKSIVPSALRLELSSLMYSSTRTDGSSIKLSIGTHPPTLTSGSMPCVATSSCIYKTPGVPSTGISFSSYDSWYAALFTKMNQCLDYHLSSTNPNDRLYF